MTVQNETSSIEHSGNGVSDEFSFPFKITAKTDLAVTVVTDATGARSTKTVDVDFTVDGVGATAGGTITFTSPPAAGTTIVIEDDLSLTQPTVYRNQGDFYPETHENSFDRSTRQAKKLKRLVDACLSIPSGTDNYDAGGVKIVDLADGVDATDAATVGQLDEAVQALGAGFAGSSVAVASGTGDGSNVNLSFPGITVTVDAAYLLVVGGVLQKPGVDFTVDVPNERLVATTAPGNTVPWFAISIGYERAINVLAAGTIGTAQLDDDAVTFAKMQNIATDTLLGRSTAGTGNVETITCTSAGRALLDDANAAAQRTTLGIDAALILSLLPTGTAIKRSYSEVTAEVNVSTPIIPLDNTKPQNTEGTEVITASITPSSATNRVRVRATIPFHSDTGLQVIAALFRDSGADALQARVIDVGAVEHKTITLEFEHCPATTSATTYKVRVGPDSVSGGPVIKVNLAATNFGSTSAATLVLEEVTAT